MALLSSSGAAAAASAQAPVAPTAAGASKRGKAAPPKLREATQVLALTRENDKSRAELLARCRAFFEHRKGFDGARRLQEEIDALRRQKESAAIEAATQVAADSRRALSSSMSVASDESDGLALLEAELSHEFSSRTATFEDPSRSRAQEKRGAARLPADARRLQQASVASVGSDVTSVSIAESDGLAELQAELNASLLAVGGAATDRKDDAVGVYNSGVESSGDEESDDGGLAELEAELEAEVAGVTSTAAKKPAKTTTRSRATPPTSVKTQSRARAPAAAKSRAALGGRRALVQAKRSSDAISIATESDDGALAALEAELELSLVAAAAPPPPPPPPVMRTTADKKTTAPRRAQTAKTGSAGRRSADVGNASGGGAGKGIARAQAPRSISSAISIATTESDDDALAELQAELSLAIEEAMPPPSVAPPSAVANSTSTAPISSTSAVAKSAKNPRKRAAGIAPRTAPVRRTRAASILSVESDGGALNELQAELERAAVMPTASAARRAVAVADTRPRPTVSASAERKRAVSLEPTVSRSDGDELAALQAELEFSAPAASVSVPSRAARVSRTTVPSQTLQPRASAKRRKVSDAYSIATTESDDGLAELQAELERSAAAQVVAERAPAPAAPRRTKKTNDKVETIQELAPRASLPAKRTRGAPQAANDAEVEVLESAVGGAAASSRKRRDVRSTPKPPTEAVKKKSAAAGGAKAARVTKVKAVETKTSKSTAATATSQQLAVASATSSAPVRVQERLPSSTPVAIAVTSSDDDSDGGLGELEAELQASIA